MNRRAFIMHCCRAFGLFIAYSFSAAAQQDLAQPAAPADMPVTGHMTDILTDKLALTDDRNKQIAPIIAGRQAQLKESRNDQSLRRP